MHVLTITVNQAAMAMIHVPAASRRTSSFIPTVVSHSRLRPYSPARPPANASKNTAPSTIPCSAVHSSIGVIFMVLFLPYPLSPTGHKTLNMMPPDECECICGFVYCELRHDGVLGSSP